MIVYDTSLIRLKVAFEGYRSSAGDLPTEVKVRQLLKSPAQLQVELTYPDRVEKLVVE